MNSKRTKLSSIERLPSLFKQTLINSENEYRREINRKLDQLHLLNRDMLRRRQATDHLFASEHLSKRYQWFNIDKSYRDECRTRWNKSTNKIRTNHVILPNIYQAENINTTTLNNLQVDENDTATITDEKIKRKFLYVQPVMIEILNAPHSSKIVKTRQVKELRKMSAQRRQQYVQRNAIDDPRYRQLVSALEDN